MNLQTLIEEAGYETRSYSGRGMYGDTCLGFECNERIGDVIASLLDVISSMDEEGRDEALDLAHEFRHMKSDSMGRGSIYYFEGVPFEGDSEDADEEESEEKLEALS